MSNFEQLEKQSRDTRQLIHSVIDNFLIGYADRNDNMSRKAKKAMAKYRHIRSEMPDIWYNMSWVQLIAHDIFKQDGLIKSYIHHSGLNHLTLKEKAFLEYQKNHPWRWSYSEITGRPYRDFFEMKDVFTGDSYLLQSPALSDIVESLPTKLCFNLILYDGSCWQAYGPVGSYAGFEPEDIHFFASQLNKHDWIEDDKELMEKVEKNPVPFMYLAHGADMTETYHLDDKIVEITAEYIDDSFDAKILEDKFTIEFKKGVYRISQPAWIEFPHYCAAYYVVKEELLFFYSMTDRAFNHIIRQFNNCGYKLSFEPDIRVTMEMMEVAEEILKKEIELNPYDYLFQIKSSQLPNEDQKRMNVAIEHLALHIYEGVEPNIEKMAQTYQLPRDLLQSMYDGVANGVNKLK